MNDILICIVMVVAVVLILIGGSAFMLTEEEDKTLSKIKYMAVGIVSIFVAVRMLSSIFVLEMY